MTFLEWIYWKHLCCETAKYRKQCTLVFNSHRHTAAVHYTFSIQFTPTYCSCTLYISYWSCINTKHVPRYHVSGMMPNHIANCYSYGNWLTPFITLIVWNHLCTITKHFTLEIVTKLQYCMFYNSFTWCIHERHGNLCE